MVKFHGSKEDNENKELRRILQYDELRVGEGEGEM